MPCGSGGNSRFHLATQSEKIERSLGISQLEARVDLELATGHYHAGHLAEKARAGFQIYARSEDTAGLRRVRDEREIMTAILSL